MSPKQFSLTNLQRTYEWWRL